MKKALIVIDMQNDFITGALPNPEGQKIVDKIANLIRDFDGDVLVTRDTHDDNYLETQEGKYLPIPHCIEGTEGWEIVPEIQEELNKKPAEKVRYFNKYVFGCIGLGEFVARKEYDEVELVGVCTDICVLSNAMIIKACAPKTLVSIHRDLCAGVNPVAHEIALQAMAGCQCEII